MLKNLSSILRYTSLYTSMSYTLALKKYVNIQFGSIKGNRKCIGPSKTRNLNHSRFYIFIKNWLLSLPAPLCYILEVLSSQWRKVGNNCKNSINSIKKFTERLNEYPYRIIHNSLFVLNYTIGVGKSNGIFLILWDLAVRWARSFLLSWSYKLVTMSDVSFVISCLKIMPLN